MRLWSLHPTHLDTRGLVALWREGLLAQKVLQGKTKGFKNHPQLNRFRVQSNPQKAIENYLIEIWKEGKKRGFNFNKIKIRKHDSIAKMPLTVGQLEYEFNWLCSKLKRRDPHKYKELLSLQKIECHPIFKLIKGGVEDWEKEKK
jgi:hypothetical protein